MALVEDSPSAERRKSLKQADAANQLRVLGSCPISKYINIADRLIDRFHFAVDGRRLDEAYVFGLRFANLCLSSLPQHPEWKQHSNSKARKRLTSQVGDVLGMMDVIKQRMDAEELLKIKEKMMLKEQEEAREKEMEQLRKHQLDEQHNREQRIRDALEEERAKYLAEQRSQRQDKTKQTTCTATKKTKASKKEDVEKSAMAKLQAMQSLMLSKEKHPRKGEETSTNSKKNKKNSQNRKIKAKEDKIPIPKNVYQGRKEKLALKSKNEQPTLSSPCPTQPSKTKDGTPALLSFSASKKEKTVMNNTSRSVTQRDARDQSLERKSSLEENSTKKPMLATAVKNGGNKIKTKKNELEINTMLLTQNKKNEFDPPAATISTKGSTESKRKYPASTIGTSSEKKKNETKPIPTRGATISMEKSPKIKPKSYIKSKLEAAKSTMSTMSPSILIPSTSTALTKSAPGNTTLNHDTQQNHTTTAHISLQHTPRNRKEKAIIDKLQRTISVQEDRIAEIEERQIPSLLHAAKTFLKENNKKEALKCLAHKKRLERQLDTTKAAVFNMETQMFMLESAIEDRYVKKALDEAATAIAGFQQNMSDSKSVVLDTMNMNESLPELDIGDFTDEELMEELQEWLSPEDKRKAQADIDSNDDDTLLLSMPTFLPTAPTTAPLVDRILEVVTSE